MRYWSRFCGSFFACNRGMKRGLKSQAHKTDI